jgi:hypothetical protein
VVKDFTGGIHPALVMCLCSDLGIDLIEAYNPTGPETQTLRARAPCQALGFGNQVMACGKWLANRGPKSELLL